MKIMIAYPPIESPKGVPLLGQNRQFQFFHNPTYIFPIVPASAATLLKSRGYDVVWKDGIAENLSSNEFYSFFAMEKPDVIVIETKTPVIKKQWKIVDALKKINPGCKIVLMGDHVTSLPKESLQNSKADFILLGGDYDFALLELVDSLAKKKEVPGGFYFRKGGRIVNTGKFQLSHNLDEAPFIDRELTKWQLYQKEYNMRGRPYMYIMSGRDCWWGKCKFCAWPTLYPRFRARSVKNVLDEIGQLIEKYDIKEIFDDSGTLCVGKWLKELCYGLIKRGYSRKIKYSCNMRFNALNQEDYNLMKKAGFRLLKFGLESANQATLDRLNKGIKIQDITNGCKMAKKAGLTVHLTMIIGYPWETKQDALGTFNLAKKLMQSGLADVLQATVLIPYPGTPLWKESLANKWFLFNPKDYERYDMSESVLKTPMKPKEVMGICDDIYKIFLTPSYILQRIKSIKSFDDLLFNLRGVKAVTGHLKDFARQKK